MRANQLPQTVLAELVEMDERTSALIAEAQQAEARLDRARTVINGKDNSITPEEFAWQRDNFDAIHTAAKLARERAEAQRRVLNEAKRWVETLPSDARLLAVAAVSTDLDLTALQAKLQTMREDLRQLEGRPPASSAISDRIDELVAGLGRAAMPMVRGYAQGQVLDVRWPSSITSNRQNGVGFSTSDVNPLLMFAALFPDEVASLIMQAVTQAQPLSAVEHEARRRELEHAIDELSYALSAALEKAGELPDPQVAPWHVLSVRIGETESAEAAAVA